MIAELFDALLVRASEPACWQELHDLLIECVVHGEYAQSSALLEKIISGRDNPAHTEYRFSILYNVANARTEFAEICFQKLGALASNYQNRRIVGEYWHFVLRHRNSKATVPVDDSGFRDVLREAIIGECKRILEERGPNYRLGADLFSGLVQRVSWPAIEKELCKALIEVVESATVPFVNKADALACLAYLCQSGSRARKSLIARAAMRWTREDIQGVDLGLGGGPLAVVRFVGMQRADITSHFLLLLDALVENAADTVSEDAAYWVRVNGLRQANEYCAFVIRIALNLSIYYADKEEGLSGALIGVAEGVAQAASHGYPARIVHGFQSVLFSGKNKAAVEVWRNSAAGRSTLDVWAARLCEIARVADADAREAVAVILRKWSEAQVEFRADMVETIAALKLDTRMRVRQVFES
ncbi:MAG: hypothetical protein IT428_26100 [Planctomycetaceae bacterium]|nr:hypothetical protein [Planctomycetaceae bacterium]